MELKRDSKSTTQSTLSGSGERMVQETSRKGGEPFPERGNLPNELWEMIIKNLRDSDIPSLLACRATCTDFQEFVDTKTTLWSRQSLMRAVEDASIDVCRLIIEKSKDKNPRDEPYSFTPMHEAARLGRLDVCRLIVDHVEDKNPQNRGGFTPLHFAAMQGHVEICRLIMDRVTDKNPEDVVQGTPLHCAAIAGHLEVCRLIISNVKEKNPSNFWGWTPLERAEKKGHTAICQLIKDALEK